MIKRKILITGGAGFIASSLADKLIENENNFVVIVDDLSTGSLKKLPKNTTNKWKFIKGNVNIYKTISEIMLAYKFDYVFHYAAMVGVIRTQENPVSVLQDIKGFENVLSLSKNTGVKRIFFSSSSEIYGEPVEFPQNVHTTPLNSRVPYAIVKNVGEAFIKSYKQEFDLDYTIFRFFNTYGPKQSKDFVISKFLSLASQNKDVTIYGDGSQTRTFCYIDDNIDTCLKMFYDIAHSKENNTTKPKYDNIINIGGSNEMSIKSLAELIIKTTGSSSKIIGLPPLKDGDMTRRLPDNTNMIKILNRELISIEDGLNRLISHLGENYCCQ